jgi:hypothetical protein
VHGLPSGGAQGLQLLQFGPKVGVLHGPKVGHRTAVQGKEGAGLTETGWITLPSVG